MLRLSNLDGGSYLLFLLFICIRFGYRLPKAKVLKSLVSANIEVSISNEFIIEDKWK